MPVIAQDAQGTSEDLAAQLEVLKQENEQLRRAVQAATEELSGLQCEGMGPSEPQVVAPEASCVPAETALKAAEDEIEDLQDKLKNSSALDLAPTKPDQTKELEAAEAEKAELGKALEKAQKERDALEEALKAAEDEAQSARDESGAEVEAKESELAEADAEIAVLVDELEEAQTKLDDQAAQLEDMRDAMLGQVLNDSGAMALCDGSQHPRDTFLFRGAGAAESFVQKAKSLAGAGEWVPNVRLVDIPDAIVGCAKFLNDELVVFEQSNGRPIVANYDFAESVAGGQMLDADGCLALVDDSGVQDFLSSGRSESSRHFWLSEEVSLIRCGFENGAIGVERSDARTRSAVFAVRSREVATQ